MTSDGQNPRLASEPSRFPPMVINALREWKLACPASDLDLVFPNGAGKVESHANIVTRGLIPALQRAGISGRIQNTPMRSGTSMPHGASTRTQDGGLALPPKSVQERLGHSSIVMTMDVYGHLFPRGDDAEELAAAEAAMFR